MEGIDQGTRADAVGASHMVLPDTCRNAAHILYDSALKGDLTTSRFVGIGLGQRPGQEEGDAERLIFFSCLGLLTDMP